MNDLFEYQFQVLLKEYDALQANIRSYDRILFQIKGWAITVFSAMVLFSIEEGSVTYLVFCGTIVLLFWCLDGMYKGFQRAFITRHNKLEHYLRRPEFARAVEQRAFKGFNVPDIRGRVSVKDRLRKVNPWKASLYWHTSLLYVAMMVFLLGLGFWLHVEKAM